MKPMCMWMLLLLSICESAFSQQNSADSRLIVEAVECRGNSTIPCDFIRSKLHLSATSQVDDDAVQSAQLRLSALPSFESVRVFLEKGSEKGKALLIVEVVEASPIVTELALGVRNLAVDLPDTDSDPEDELTEFVTARISHQNLFGRQKLGELTVSGNHSSYEKVDTDRLGTSLSYIDPNLLGSDRWFLSLSGEYDYVDRRIETTSYNPFAPSMTLVAVQADSESRVWRVAMSLGYRLWDYSYLFGRLEQQNASFSGSIEYPSLGIIQTSDSKDRANIAMLGYGWDSEDDAYFPTRGSRLSAAVNYVTVDQASCSTCEQLDWRIAYKQSWMMGKKSVWTLNVGGEPYAVSDRLRPVEDFSTGTLGLKYSYLLDSSDSLGGIRRGRWYLALGTGPVQLSREGEIGDPFDQAHVTLGLRFESKMLGIVDLYASASQFWPQMRNSQ